MDKFVKSETCRLGISNQCKECKSKYDKEYRKRKGKEYLDGKKKYRDKNREKINEKQRSAASRSKRRLWRKRKMKDANYALKEKLNARMRTSMNQAVKGIKNRKSWKDILGYDWEDLKDHLQSLFTEGMTWDKFLSGQIHIDHIIPIDSFEFTDVVDEQFIKCWSLENLQPLWDWENLKKSNSLKYV
jgi:hypothetical protein